MKNEIDELFGSNEVFDIALSYSRLSDFDRNGAKALNKRTEISGDGVRIGSVVDDLLLDKENFTNKYFIYDGEKPTATLGKLIDIVLENYTKIPSKKKVLDIIQINEFWKRIKPEILLARFDIPEFWDYLKAQYKSKIKTLITTSDLELGKRLVEVLTTHEFSKDLFNNDLEQIHQFKFNFIYKNFKLRGIIDMVLIDHNKKTIQLIDLKTGQDTAEKFINSFIKYRYYFQEAIYMKSFDAICKDLGLKDYTLLPFQFLYIGRKQQLPLLYTVPSEWHTAAIKGFQSTTGFFYRGIDEVIDTITWHWKNKVFDMSMNTYLKKGKVLLDTNYLNIK